ncbi:hypothetical protein [Lewinella sp. LCG006]|uniref:hypothetical protein n=1 Tax=Lewinella sp. LCG006 TaxID=3231911 RepID=UPI00345F3E24
MIDYETYTYQTPEKDRRRMSEPRALPEFAEEAASIITDYTRRYKPQILPIAANEGLIRDLLAYERMTKRKLRPEARDYWVKVYLLLIDRDFEYEKELMEAESVSVETH